MGVRSRILATFVIGALLLSSVLFFLTYTLTRSNLAGARR